MTRDEFQTLLLTSLGHATSAAEEQFGQALPHHFGILRDSSKAEGRRISVEQALSDLWLGDDRFYCIIDVAVVEASPGTTWLWVRESGHPPASFEGTWNQPLGAWPFKLMLPIEIRRGDTEAV